ncbi:MAG TPA: polymerase [Algoriphagus sp.]|jgi:OOP family OmpA-OmpF porin|uniref:OmpA family protein n=1 Tax=unclassified Algoriphagus TaxID=2641541 RepID=UPI000C42C81A|nr:MULTISPECIES: OmpA family protein [unclassified Algoriphagus]MAL15868.1 polymerase [Algoriphagus sp.]QYH37318.1 OmpA family protein [Algoriphagus sp. NBT04N3]HAD52529.1 polymerase [Algoriphagus sp.]HAH36424.1 polymerase [Algoriphagus sp.]HAS60806.1 polymerase [Algoriphagus sp.]
MKKLILSTLMAGALAIGASAQDYDKLSLEINGGFNKPMAPLAPQFLSPTLNIGHVDFGVRYMFNEKFGAKLDYGFGSMSEANGNRVNSLQPFDTNYWRLNLQGVANMGRVLNFESFSRSFGLLLHGGAGMGAVKPQSNRFAGTNDIVYNLIFGLTPQLKLSKNIALVGDISTILNGRQTVSWDGSTEILPDLENGYYGTNGTWWTGTIGLNFYLGKSEEHADWYIAADKYATKEELASQINGIKDMLKDSDGDGVPDYLDKEPNTPAGARVNSAGTTLDSDGDGTPDHLDKCPFQPGPASTNGCPVEEVREEVDYLKKAINDGYVNVYYAFDSSKPLGYSISAANYVANFLKRNPGVSVEIKGYADELGPEDYNMKLSEKRAKAVYDILIAAGINSSRLSYKGYGEDTSVDKSSADARQMARRASFEVK